MLIFSHWIIVFLLAPLFVGVIAKVKAFFAGKKGPSLFQPFFDLQRLFQKDSVYSRTTTWVFRAVPIICLAAVLLLALLVPLGPFKAPLQFTGDIFLAASILGLARFFMIIAALDTGYSFEGMGASREAFFSCLCEMILFMNFITLSLAQHSISLSSMIGGNLPLSWKLWGTVLILVVGSFFILILAENARIPIDDPDTHLELTMIHEVKILDHSGVDLGFLLYASAIKLFVFAGILIPIILPIEPVNKVMDMLIFLGGMLAVSIAVGIVESTTARLRLNRVNHLLLIAFALGFFGFVVKMWKG
ncbi:MAG: NADH-quinone oxidoreductase subunit H [Candidatus Omnitrophica bacterium]|nr:NADH-quinone oxidoreductase subunit H [Candidatus Omnitrophota bacterium]